MHIKCTPHGHIQDTSHVPLIIANMQINRHEADVSGNADFLPIYTNVTGDEEEDNVYSLYSVVGSSIKYCNHQCL